MELVIKVNPQNNPNQVGEILRRVFFVEEVGCYDCFEWSENVKSLPDEAFEGDDGIPEESNARYTCGELKIENEVVKCRYHWDGDGDLQFVFQNGDRLRNSDCKCDYDWKYLTAEQYKAQ